MLPMPSSSNGFWPEEINEDPQMDGRDSRVSVLHRESSDEIRRRKSKSEGAHESPMAFPPLDPVFSSPPGAFRMERKSIPAKKPANEKKWRWKKPKDRPKRPLSAYNIFFQHERQTLRDVRMLPYADNADRTLGFAGLAKHVSTKWKNLDQGSKSAFEKLAAVEKQKYFVSLDQWKKEKEGKDTTAVADKPTPTEASNDEAATAVSTASPEKPAPAAIQQEIPNNKEAGDCATASAMQHQQNMMMAQMVLSHQMSSMPMGMGQQYTMAAAMQEQAAMIALQNSYLSVYPRSMSMPMGMELQTNSRSEHVVPKTQRSMSMPMGAVPANWSSSHEAEHDTHELDGEGELVQVDTVSELPRFSSRRLSMPMTGTETRVASSVKMSRRSASMPLVNMEYISNHAVDQEYYVSPEFKGGYSSSNYLDQHHSHLQDPSRGNEHPDGVIISRRLSMPVTTADSSSSVAVMVQRRSSSMPMVNMEYFTNANTNLAHSDGSSECDQLSADLQEASNLAEGDMVRDGVIYSRRMSMPAAMPTATMVQPQHSVTVSRRSMSMPMVNTEYAEHEQMQHYSNAGHNDDGLGGAMDMNMEDEFDDLLSQLRGSG
jgi:hypothetical protein